MNLRRLLASAVMLVGATLAITSPSAAQSAVCSDVTVSTSDILVPWNPISGPHSVSVPAGTYRLVGSSSDFGHLPGQQTDQTHEQWSFTTDTGYTSPISPDLPDADTIMTFVLVDEVTFDSPISVVTFNHHSPGTSPDSVTPSITFQCVEGAISSSTTVPPSTTAAPSTTGQTPTTAPPSTTEPSTTGPATTAPPTTEPASTTQPGAVSPTSVVPDPDDGEGGGTLPRTGGGVSIGWIGAALFAAGAVVVATGRLSEEIAKS